MLNAPPFDFQPRLPEGALLLPFRRAHAMAMRHNEFQQVVIDHFPAYYDYLEAQAACGPAFTIIYRGVVQACFGAVPLGPGNAEAWLLRDDRIGTYAVPTARAAKLFFDRVGTALELRRCQITVNANFSSALRFAEWLGFEIEGALRRFGVDGTDHYMMSRLY